MATLNWSTIHPDLHHSHPIPTHPYPKSHSPALAPKMLHTAVLYHSLRYNIERYKTTQRVFDVIGWNGLVGVMVGITICRADYDIHSLPEPSHPPKPSPGAKPSQAKKVISEPTCFHIAALATTNFFHIQSRRLLFVSFAWPKYVYWSLYTSIWCVTVEVESNAVLWSVLLCNIYFFYLFSFCVWSG